MLIMRSILLTLLAVLMLSGCASTRFQVGGTPPQQSLCQSSGERALALVLWGPKWRPDQKDVPSREAAAQRGIERFFSSSGCFSEAKVMRRIGDRESVDLGPAEVRAHASAYQNPGYVVFIVVRELGPIIKFHSPALLEGGTDVVLEVRIASPATGETMSSLTSHWQHGGPWVIKGVGTLEQDIVSALQETFKPPERHGDGQAAPGS